MTKSDLYVSCSDATSAQVMCARDNVLGRANTAPNLEHATSQGAVIVMSKVSVGTDVTDLKPISFSEAADKLSAQTLGGSAGESEEGMCQITDLFLNNQSGALGDINNSGTDEPSGITLLSSVAFWGLINDAAVKLGVNSSASKKTSIFIKIEGANDKQMFDFSGATIIAGAFTNSGDNIILSTPIGDIRNAIKHRGSAMDAHVHFTAIYSATVGFSDSDDASKAAVVTVGAQ